MTFEKKEAYRKNRFNGIETIYGASYFENLQHKHICIIGIGGVGSWVTECLARSGVGNITLIDLDHITISNTNRQIHALEGNYGKSKILAMQERIHQINCMCCVHMIDDFVTPNNISNIMQIHTKTYAYDYIIDATDDIQAKQTICLYALQQNIPFIICGAAGGKTNPCSINIDLLSNVTHDPLLAKLRYVLRKQHQFSQRITIECIYSTQPIQKNCPTSSSSTKSAGSALACAGMYGSVVGITATMGFILGQHVLNKIYASGNKT
jgi:tRNA threonylcarbamoyladenosine dehydratase